MIEPEPPAAGPRRRAPAVRSSGEANIATRRTLTGRPLLLASGVALAVSCGGKGKQEPEPPVGNLMAPPLIEPELCVDVVPEDATVTINGVPTSERCTPVQGREGDTVRVEVLLPGRAAVVRELELTGPPRPVGNLMAPPELPK